MGGHAVSVTVLRPDIHLVKDTPASKFFRRQLRDPDILTFWCQPTGMWVLAYWLSRSKRIVDEMEDLGANFELMTDDLVNMLVSCYGSVDLKRTKKRLLSKNADRIRKQNDDIYESQERWDWLKRKTSHKSPIPYVFSPSPVERGY
jgi:hypothetical protein